jgi:hypothetical protein
MALSQNVLFTGGPRDLAHPPGEPVARGLADGLTNRGYVVSEFENWQDSGWILRCVVDDIPFDVALGTYGDSEWLVQIAVGAVILCITFVLPSYSA